MSIENSTNQELFSEITARMNELRDRMKQNVQDRMDLLSAANTEFYRCKCGRIRERGLHCIDPDCTVDEDDDE